jgi:16S rRNA (adenine1518-N6/adenine1519-N6)-dimethyltransferase
MPKKSLGQYFLYDPLIIEGIIEAAQLEPDDLVVEIGPGPGSLTRRLAEKVQHLIAIELDAALYEKLTAKLAGYDNIDLIRGDALEYRYEDLPAFKAVANIPYYITTPIIFRLLDSRKNLKSMTLTIQKEVAERIVAAPGGKDYGVLSIMVQYCADSSLQFIIPKQAFRPSPKVDSAVVHMRILDTPPVVVRDEKLFFRIVRTAFSQRRKMLSNSLRTVHEDAAGWLRKAGIDPRRRPETLSMEEFARLADTSDFS